MKPIRLAVLLSGGGRTVLNLLDRIEDGSLTASIDLVISSRPDVAGVERLRARGLEVQVEPDDRDDAARQAWVAERIRASGVDLVCLCGYLRWLQVDPAYADRVINIHPSLLPEFGGRGMFGLSVHRAVLAAGRSVSGCTVHFVDEQYDHGPVLLQRTCPVEPGDDEHRLADRVFEQECIAYPEAIRLIAAGRVRVARGMVEILPETHPATNPE